MSVTPIVRYMILCDDVLRDPGDDRRVSILGLISNIRPSGDEPYPLTHAELCVFLSLTEGRGQGIGKIACVDEESGRVAFETPQRSIRFGDDPLDVIGITFRIRSCPFPRPGLYAVQFLYNGVMIEDRPLRLR
jgi:hypothetical protein